MVIESVYIEGCKGIVHKLNSDAVALTQTVTSTVTKYIKSCIPINVKHHISGGTMDINTEASKHYLAQTVKIAV